MASAKIFVVGFFPRQPHLVCSLGRPVQLSRGLVFSPPESGVAGIAITLKQSGPQLAGYWKHPR